MLKRLLIILILISLFGCTYRSTNINNNQINGEDTEAAIWNKSTNSPTFFSTNTNDNHLISVYFSDPPARENESYNYGPEIELVNAIKSARVTVDIAVYNINLWNIRDALIDAFNRGLKVRMVIESENLSDEVPQQLLEAGIEIRGDRRESLMHNKFVILDRQDVWTGSMNFSIGSAYYDNNNLVHIRSKDVALDYLTEFNEMFDQDMFGDNTVPSTPYPNVFIGNTKIEIYFSPDDKVSDHLIEIINQAQYEIVFMAYSFTSDSIREAIVSKYHDGISVSGIMDDEQAQGNMGSEYETLKSEGLNIQLDGNSGLMHHKVIIIDQRIVITGSYNLSMNAEIRNDENVIIIHDPEIADQYLNEYFKILFKKNNK